VRALGEPFQQAARLPTDGAVTLTRDGEDHFILSVVTDGVVETIRVSEYNLSRLVGIGTIFLGIRIHKNDGKALKL
jgi:hypothetical protein